MPLTHRQYALALLGTFALFWLALAIRPLDRADWLLENALVLLAVPLLVGTWGRFRFSRFSYTLLFLFFCLHEIGAHYTYSEVPYDAWLAMLAGPGTGSLAGEGRNHFDRLVHFSFGLLLAYPMREIFVRIADAKGFWSYYLPFDMVMAFSMVFELIEWAAAEIFGGDLGVAYLGTQGDVWDAHKDMALASLGALITMTATAIVNLRHRRDFAREWIESLRVKPGARP